MYNYYDEETLSYKYFYSFLQIYVKQLSKCSI